MTDGEKTRVEIGLREYVKELLHEHDKQNILRFEAQSQSIQAARVDLERRLDSLNHLRDEVGRDRAMFVKLETYNVKTAYYDSWCRGVDEKLTTLNTRSLTWTAAIGVAFTLVQIALHFLLWQAQR